MDYPELQVQDDWKWSHIAAHEFVRKIHWARTLPLKLRSRDLAASSYPMFQCLSSHPSSTTSPKWFSSRHLHGSFHPISPCWHGRSWEDTWSWAPAEWWLLAGRCAPHSTSASEVSLLTFSLHKSYTKQVYRSWGHHFGPYGNIIRSGSEVKIETRHNHVLWSMIPQHLFSYRAVVESPSFSNLLRIHRKQFPVHPQWCNSWIEAPATGLRCLRPGPERSSVDCRLWNRW